MDEKSQIQALDRTAPMLPMQPGFTPQALFDELTAEFGFTLDAAALASSALCPSWVGPGHPDLHRRDALRWLDWADLARGGNTDAAPMIFVDPPYGVGLGAWAQRAARIARKGVGVVGLLPARTDTQFWHRDVVADGAEIRFVRGRLHFNDGPLPAPFARVISRGGRSLSTTCVCPIWRRSASSAYRICR